MCKQEAISCLNLEPFSSNEYINLLRAKICKMQEMLYYSLELLYKKKSCHSAHRWWCQIDVSTREWAFTNMKWQEHFNTATMFMFQCTNLKVKETSAKSKRLSTFRIGHFIFSNSATFVLFPYY